MGRLSQPPVVTVCSKTLHTRAKLDTEDQKYAHDNHISVIEAPLRILLPKDCIAEIFIVPQGTEIRIRATTKLDKETK
jgi:hypothetical protein